MRGCHEDFIGRRIRTCQLAREVAARFGLSGAHIFDAFLACFVAMVFKVVGITPYVHTWARYVCS